jgi:hypothetical protein
VTIPGCPACAPIVALKAVTLSRALAMPSICSAPMPASPTSWPDVIHSPPLTSRCPGRRPTGRCRRRQTLAATPSRSSVPLPAAPTTTVPVAAIFRGSDRAVAAAASPMTRAFGVVVPVEGPLSARAAHQDEKPAPRAHGRLLLRGGGAPPASMSAPPLSTTSATPLRLDTTCPVGVVP